MPFPVSRWLAGLGACDSRAIVAQAERCERSGHVMSGLGLTVVLVVGASRVFLWCFPFVFCFALSFGSWVGRGLGGGGGGGGEFLGAQAVITRLFLVAAVERDAFDLIWPFVLVSSFNTHRCRRSW